MPGLPQGASDGCVVHHAMAPSDAIGRNEAATLGVSINTDTSKDPADGVDRLLGCVRADAKDQTTCRTAVVALERFFSERLCRGDLRVAPTTPATTRFGEQYKAFVRRLCAILADEIVADEDAGDARARRLRASDGASGGAAAAASPRTQVLALRAVMELARSEQPGKFNNEMYERALRAMVTGGAFSPEMLGALTGRYLRCHDVRHYTYAAVGRMADEFRRDCGAAAGDKRRRDDDDVGDQDIARNLYDVLVGCPPDFTDYAGSGACAKGPVASAASAPKKKKTSDVDDDAAGEDFEAMLGLMKSADAAAGVGGEDARGGAEWGAEGGAEDPHGAWCKGVPVGELAAIDAAANRRRDGKKLTAKGRERAIAAATKEADACRARASTQRDKWADGKRRRELFQRTWLALLRSPFPDDIYRKILVRAHADVMPHMPSPVTLSDFFTASIDRGGLDGMLALNGIFHLMTKHQLEYPKFYDRLYGLLDSSCFRAANRRGFFELLDVFLKSPALPAYLAAAFIKRMSRLAIHAPPAGAVLAVAYCHNLLRRHPGCGVMVHRENGKSTESDPFVADEPDPARCRALESSIWEMEAMSKHYHAQVSKFSEVLKKDLNDRVKTAEIPVKDICEANYGSLISEELRARVKTAPMASMFGGYRGLFRDAVTAECLGGSVRWAAQTE